MKISIRPVLATSLSVIVSGGFGPHSWAAGRPSVFDPPPAVTVRFGDLNTSTPQGIRELYSRLRMAANEVCDTQSWYPSAYWSQRLCSRATLDNLVIRLNLPRLTALHRDATHSENPVLTVKH